MSNSAQRPWNGSTMNCNCATLTYSSNKEFEAMDEIIEVQQEDKLFDMD
jgi:hypothetical protein